MCTGWQFLKEKAPSVKEVFSHFFKGWQHMIQNPTGLILAVQHSRPSLIMD